MPVAVGARQAAFPARGGFFKGALAGLRGERVLGRKVAIKAAVGQAGPGHQLGDADAVQSALAEQPRRRLLDRLAVLVGLFA
ncbi:hypothetical protein D9M71_832980 [compost metagenome]